ncbi:MAG: hypothetical protein R2828_26485 [Saprospiraceae bacterium]
MKQPLNVFLPLILVVFLGFLPYATINPCGYNSPSFGGYSLIHPFLMEEPLEEPVLLSRSLVSADLFGEASERKIGDENIAEWRTYFDQVPTEEAISQVIYQSSIEDLMAIGQKIRQPKRSLSEAWQNNAAVQHLLHKKDTAFVNYLIYAKQCEPLATIEDGQYMEVDGDWKWVPKDETAAANLVEMGQACYSEVKDKYLKMRYAFQLVRFDHYYGGNPVATYDQYVKPLEKIGSVMQYWAMGHVGGFLAMSDDLKEKIEGNYLLAKVVSHTKSRAIANWRSMNINTDMEWDMLQMRCQSKEEKANLHYLRSLDQQSLGLEEMQQIYALDPTFEKLDVLLIREIQKMERVLLKELFPSKHELPFQYQDITVDFAKSYVRRLKTFVAQVAKEGKTERQPLWQVSEAYLAYLAGEYEASKELFQLAKKQLKGNDFLKDQLEIFEFALELSRKETIDEPLESWLGQLITKNKAFQTNLKFGTIDYAFDEASQEWTDIEDWYYDYDNFDFITKKMAHLYAKKEEIGKAYLCRYSIYGLKYFMNSQIAKQVLAIMDEPNKNAWESFLVQKEAIKDRNEVLDILATSLIGEERYQEALDVLKQLPAQEASFYNPFESQMSDTKLAIDSTTNNWMNKANIVQRQLQLAKAIQQGAGNEAANHLAMGNFLYNTSYWGHAWQVRDYYISVNSLYGYNQPKNFMDYGEVNGNPGGIVENIEFIDLSKAKTHFQNAMKKGSPEIAAQACFMLAKIAYSESLLEINERDFKPRNQLYEKMLSQYGDTDYFKSAIRECKFFEHYVSKER